MKEENFECDKCGACCQHLLIEIEQLDLIREPRLIPMCRPLRRDPDDPDRDPIEVVPGFQDGAKLNRPCPMLGPDKLCQIYSSRPNICVGFMAGSLQCQVSRRSAGLPPLEPVAGSTPAGQNGIEADPTQSREKGALTAVPAMQPDPGRTQRTPLDRDTKCLGREATMAVRAIVPPLKWHGGKHYLARRIVARMPPHIHYVEPYAGGLAVLLAKDPEGVSEVVNDLHGELTNFWRVLQDPATFARFRRTVEAIPFSEPEWNGAGGLMGEHDTVTGAIAFFVRCRQSLAGRTDTFAPLSRRRTRRVVHLECRRWHSSPPLPIDRTGEIRWDEFLRRR
jgi:hypothetical protein